MTDQATRVTLADIAREADVSLSTISKVLNGRSDVSAATRDRVEGLLEAPAGLQVEQLARDVDARDLEVVLALAL